MFKKCPHAVFEGIGEDQKEPLHDHKLLFTHHLQRGQAKIITIFRLHVVVLTAVTIVNTQNSQTK
jgi:hypothetical protein